MKKYLVKIEFRYSEVPKSEIYSECKSKTITIGIFDDFDTACVEGNNLMVKLESKFPLHVFPSGVAAKRERFSKNGGCLGARKTLISSSAYLKTPFTFYAKIETLKIDDIEETIEGVVASVRDYRKYRSTLID